MKNECKNILKHVTILIVDDHKGIREQLKDILSLYVSTVYEANNGQEAYELYLKYKPSIIISDINMPVLNGIELSKKIRNENKTIPIVLISAYSEKAMLLDAVKLLLIDYLIKPVLVKDLIHILETCAKSLLENQSHHIPITNKLIFNLSTNTLYNEMIKVELTHNEVTLLRLLHSHLNQIVTEEIISNEIWPDKVMTPSALRNLVLRLRKKIGKDTIQSISKLGYKLILQS